MSFILVVDKWSKLDGDVITNYKKGDLLDNLSDKDLNRLISIGAAKDNDLIVEDIKKEVSETPENNSEDKPDIVFPKNAAKIEIWRSFGEKNGVNTKGLTKAEIKAAVKSKIS